MIWYILTISPKDLQIFPLGNSNGNSSNSSLSNLDIDTDFVEMKENNEDLEKVLKEIA